MKLLLIMFFILLTTSSMAYELNRLECSGESPQLGIIKLSYDRDDTEIIGLNSTILTLIKDNKVKMKEAATIVRTGVDKNNIIFSFISNLSPELATVNQYDLSMSPFSQSDKALIRVMYDLLENSIKAELLTRDQRVVLNNCKMSAELKLKGIAGSKYFWLADKAVISLLETATREDIKDVVATTDSTISDSLGINYKELKKIYLIAAKRLDKMERPSHWGDNSASILTPKLLRSNLSDDQVIEVLQSLDLSEASNARSLFFNPSEKLKSDLNYFKEKFEGKRNIDKILESLKLI